MRKIFVWGSVASGLVAAYLMYKRGASPLSIAGKVAFNPIGSLVSELKA